MNPFSFPDRFGWSGPVALAADASARRYYRVGKGGRSAVFMDAAACAPGELARFIRIAGWLRAAGLSAPEILEADEAGGFALLEDFGDLSFRAALAEGHGGAEIYMLAGAVLGHLQGQENLPDLPDYYDSGIHKGRRRVIDWFIPAARRMSNPDGLAERYLEIWDEIERGLSAPRQGFVHADYHMDNLMLLAGREGVKRCGILDFQGAMRGPVLYDLANLLYDARAEMDGELRAEILAGLDEGERLWTRVLATQFHCRVIGQFIKFAVRDGNAKYLCHVPRLQAYIAQALEEPVLKPLGAFFSDLGLDFFRPYGLNVPEISRFIRDDAF